MSWRTLAARLALDHSRIWRDRKGCHWQFLRFVKFASQPIRTGSDQEDKALDWGILDGSVGPRVRLLRNALHGGSIAVSEPFGLPTGSLTVMALIAANPGCAQVDLAARAGITGPSLVGIIAQLESLGLVSRERDAEDRRRNMLVLTPDGQARVDDLFATVTRIEAPIRDALGPRGMAQLASLLDKAIAALDQARDNG